MYPRILLPEPERFEPEPTRAWTPMDEQRARLWANAMASFERWIACPPSSPNS